MNLQIMFVIILVGLNCLFGTNSEVKPRAFLFINSLEEKSVTG
jgi:hypothetical protein